ncbi:hypothetical protein [Serratia marcescens]|nr:hypothetical protein [Serratia marcescens]
MGNSKLRLVRGIELTTEQDMWKPSKHYRWRTGMYYGRARYVEV